MGFDQGAFIVYCNAAALPMYRLLVYRSSTQCTALQVHFLAVPQWRSRHRDGNTTTATYHNAVAVQCRSTMNALSFWTLFFVVVVDSPYFLPEMWSVCVKNPILC